MTYNLQLIAIKCIEAQELNGDEVVIKLNGAKVWQSGRYRLHPRPTHDDQVSEFDFAGGRRHGAAGWEMLTPYNPKDFVFTSLSGDSLFEVWEADFLRNDFLGRSPITERDAGRGQIAISFVRDGANYLLTYQVTA